jgi:hypothetical protein
VTAALELTGEIGSNPQNITLSLSLRESNLAYDAGYCGRECVVSLDGSRDIRLRLRLRIIYLLDMRYAGNVRCCRGVDSYSDIY